MKRRQRRQVKSSGSPKWMVTYSDMVTLILVFFILLFSMSQIDQHRFQAISESFQNRMIFDFFPSSVPMEYPSDSSSTGGNNGGDSDGIPMTNNEAADPSGNAEEEEGTAQHSSLEDNVQSFLDENDLNGIISTNRTEEGVSLVLQDSILFATGEAEILESAEGFLNKVGEFLQGIPNRVRVEGHTDSRPIYNYRYPSNWELSGARASSVIRYLIDNFAIDSQRFTSVGYAETRPVASNTSEENMQKNRRVEIVILETKEGAE
ncbi:hypothetical protein GCM10010978_24130 [Compostibacillus humi]|uniref:OmpA-like domain-containing protein n=1 Tax=Compostibacillus humi TaxID=1245525 RepID=A0A8J2TQI6_9BACI|nr:flagellar motor protein MotS [Compostibacillus humi]GFZ82545.1 hypothetical protein GCM10010978_24130 [Compostibacillus humi]